MNKIENVTTENMGESAFVKPFRVRYTQNGREKIWDCIQAHDSVCVLIHHTGRDTFVLVKQFRPAVYISNARRVTGGKTPAAVDSARHPGDQGVTYELCAGILDKEGVSNLEVARQEVLEECGYDVPRENMELITNACTGVGIMGTKQTMFYATVDDSMKKTEGGGNVDEGEMIDVVEIPVKDSLQFTYDESKIKPVGFMFAMLWFHANKAKHLTSS